MPNVLFSEFGLMGIGLVLILVAAELLLSLSKQLAARFRLSPLIVSLIIVAFGTNLPELVVSIASIQQGEAGLALGNLIGSSVVNITLVFAVASLFNSVKLGNTKTQKNGLILLSCVVIFVTTQFLGVPAKITAWLLLGSTLVAVTYQLLLGINGRKAEDRVFMQLVAKLRKRKKVQPLLKQIIYAVLAAAGLWMGGSLTVASVTRISDIIGVSTTFIGLTITSLATTLPELLTVLTASAHKENKVVIGTIIGSNIFNLTLFPAIIFGFAGSVLISWVEIGLLLAVTCVFVSMLFYFRGKVVNKFASLGLLSLFFVFIATTLYLQP
ncbi:MAG: hypothetical protein COY80_02185 [Candidatus Pacebacteria bacterium CG_4_10_14_0_8_um_filter_42_14]|nr:MAG: hypothetical protein COY80_02185 [Candidatus Pacebacteria bacterium CG_4_10_14_0_8_um_filter_42_14]